MVSSRGAWTAAALTAGCLLVFAATIPLPRADGQLVGSDGTRYYVYLPSLWLDGDLDFTDEYAYFYAEQPQTAAYLVEDRTPTGVPANRFGIGPALLWSPFFLTAHLLVVLARALGSGMPADGYGYFYQATVLAGSIVLGGLGVWFCFRAARQVATEKAALLATVLTVLAGNVVYYLTVEPSMSHAPSLFASSAFFFAWMNARRRPGWKGSWWLGALAGLMALIRPQDGLLLALPIADAAMAAWRRGRGRELARCLVPGLSAVAAAAVVFLPQLVVWKTLYGGFLTSGYAEEFGALFGWASPRLVPVLFSAQRGLFAWHPVLLLGLIGIWLLSRGGAASTAPDDRLARGFAGLCIVGFMIQWYLIASWRDWTQGDAFGGRMFIVCPPIFVIGTAVLVDKAAERWPWSRIGAVGAALVALNLLLIAQYRLVLLRAAAPPTWWDLTVGRVQFLF